MADTNNQYEYSEQQAQNMALDPTLGAFDVNLKTKVAGEDLTNDVMKVEPQAGYTNLSASALIKTGAGRVFGFIINSNTSGTLKLWDNTSGATTVLMNTYTFTTGTSYVVAFPAAVKFTTGLYATIGGTADISIIWS